ncbi:hypothetical protein AALP_AAs71351U000100, partial [Arabis alpina]
KWCTFLTTITEESSKKTKISDRDETKVRPLGVKAAKANEKKRTKVSGEETKGSASLKVLHQVWEIRDKDNLAKERLSNKKILEGLLAKPGGLTETELELKNTLMTEVLKNIRETRQELGED